MYTHALPPPPLPLPLPCRAGDIESLSPPSLLRSPSLPPEYRLFTLNFARLRRPRSDYDMRQSPYHTPCPPSPSLTHERERLLSLWQASPLTKIEERTAALTIHSPWTFSLLPRGGGEREDPPAPTIILASQPTQPLWSSLLAWGQTTTFPPQKLLCHPPTPPCKNCILRGQVGGGGKRRTST